MELTIKEFAPPVIKINYEAMAAELEKKLEEYTGLVVTEETLPGCKAAQKELAGLRNKIDDYRKEKKKEAEKPINAFESQCNALIELIKQVEKPIKDGINVFDDKKRADKRATALALATSVAEEAGLNKKYTAKLDVLDKYMNLTAKKREVREDLETRAFALKVEQDREAERLEIIQRVIDSENSRLKTKLNIDLWKRDIDRNVPTSEIIEKIKKQATMIYEAENRPAEPPKEVEPKEVPPQEESAVNEPNPQEVKQYSATLRMTGTIEELRSVSAFLKENKISYEVLDQREV